MKNNCSNYQAKKLYNSADYDLLSLYILFSLWLQPKNISKKIEEDGLKSVFGGTVIVHIQNGTVLFFNMAIT